jgi:hypothetical protein
MNWATRIINLLLLLLIMVLQLRIMQVDHKIDKANERISWLTDELVQTKKDALRVDESVASFMKHTNTSIELATQALDNHSRAIMNIAGGPR